MQGHKDKEEMQGDITLASIKLDAFRLLCERSFGIKSGFAQEQFFRVCRPGTPAAIRTPRLSKRSRTDRAFCCDGSRIRAAVCSPSLQPGLGAPLPTAAAATAAV